MGKTFEESIVELESIVAKLESGTLSLEEGINSFEQGMEIANYCNKMLEEAEKRIVKVVEKNGELVEVEI